MFKYKKYVKLLALPVFIGMSGCAELNELRSLNRRQAITIRDQSDEISNLRNQVNALSHKLKASEEEMEKLRRLAEFIGEGVTVRDTLEGPVLLFPEMVLFDSGMAKVKPKGEDALKKMARFLNENPYISLRIDGHTDTDPIVRTKHLWDSNHHLSAARSLSVFHYLTKNERITEGRIHITGFGPNRPIANNTTPAGKRENRRVEFLVLSAAAPLPPKGEDLAF
ncbi:MAG: OmpA/MotB family protein [Candidatus Loosdrechtia sp.]|uniref:OmpA/MotB family protein n=1 Tax=Candidatus Loosdrechtia sp. TaxID=3101272 RepID=UPI003A68BB35|nr:MAG: flagellar motor protein MotB [Candidatus Jettenia sp. AMX2]